MKYKRQLSVFEIGFCAVSYSKAIDMLMNMPVDTESAYASFSNVSVLIECRKNPAARMAVNAATMNCVDGMPIRWIAQKHGFRDCERCSGPDAMVDILSTGIERNWRHYFYGSSEETLIRLRERLKKDYSGIVIAGMESPPFRKLTAEEDKAATERINAAQPDWVWVGLGAPKQDIWMQEHRDKVKHARMMGVGAAFDFLAGTVKRAPEWMRRSGFEWLYRLVQEPGRLWRRYLVGNVQFIWYLLADNKPVKVLP